MNELVRTGAPARRRAVRIVAALIALVLLAALDGRAAAAEGRAGAQSPASGGTFTARPAPVKFMLGTTTRPYQEVVTALERTVAALGLSVAGEVDQAGDLLPPGARPLGAQTFFVWKAEVAQTFADADPAAGAAFPVRMYVWDRADGTTAVGYYDPGDLVSSASPELTGSAAEVSAAAELVVSTALGHAPRHLATARVRFLATTSQVSYAETLARLRHAAGRSGLAVPWELGHAWGAHTYSFWKPPVDAAWFAYRPHVGMAVPLRVYVWQDRDGTAQIGYFDPAALLRLAGKGLDERGTNLFAWRLAWRAAELVRDATWPYRGFKDSH